MKTSCGVLAAITLLCAGAHAATLNTTITVNGTGTISTTTGGGSATGTVGFSGDLTASGTFGSTFTLLQAAGGSIPVTLTVTSGGTTGTLTGTFTASATLLAEILLTSSSSASGTGTIAITGGTGGFAGATGTFNVTASGTGSGSGTATGTFTLTGAGTLTISGGTTGPPSPTITAVWDAASNSANLAPGTIFIVKGSTLCSVTSLAVYSVPRPTVGSDGVKITFAPAGGGASTDALLWYEDPLGGGKCQLAGILPSTVTPGSYNVTVTNGTASAPTQATVVASKFALFTQDSTGGGLASAQDQVSTNYYLNRLTTGSLSGVAIAPAYPGEYMVAYGTGLGAVTPAFDNAPYPTPLHDFTKDPGMTIQAVVGGVTIPVIYAGRAGFAGEDQINFQLPASVPTGCTVSFQISVNGTLSPATTLAIAPDASTSACVQPGYTAAQLQALDNGGAITSGNFSISQIQETVPQLGSFKADSASGSFTQVTAFQLASAPFSFSSVNQGSCTVVSGTFSGGTLTTGGNVNYLDAGNITLSGPSGTNLNNTAMTDTSGLYFLNIGEEGISIPGGLNGSIVAGAYTLNGAGGNDVKSFNTSITLGSPLSLSPPLPTTVVRSQPLALTWTGGNSTDPVTIFGSSGTTTTGSGATAVSTVTAFICRTTAGTGGFTVASSVLSQLQATPAAASGGTGFLEVVSGPPPVSFSPGLTAGGTVAATFSATIGAGASVIYQ